MRKELREKKRARARQIGSDRDDVETLASDSIGKQSDSSVTGRHTHTYTDHMNQFN